MFLSTAVVAIVVLTGIVLSTRSTPKASSAPAGTFTARTDGHDFGLHSCALLARSMGGSLYAQSDGPGQGAAFTLELPWTPRESAGDPPDDAHERSMDPRLTH